MIAALTLSLECFFKTSAGFSAFFFWLSLTFLISSFSESAAGRIPAEMAEMAIMRIFFFIINDLCKYFKYFVLYSYYGVGYDYLALNVNGYRLI